MQVWFNGKISEGPIALSPTDRGVTLGDGLFETILVIDGVALWLNEHLQRMRAAASELGIIWPESEITMAAQALCKGKAGSHIMRLTLTRGAGGRGLGADIDTPCFFATCTPLDPKLMFQEVRCCMVSVTRNAASPTSRMKTLSYMDQVLAAREAGEEGYDDGIMCNTEGFVACSTIGNVFLLKGNTLITPSRDQGILPGIMRRVVIEGANECGLGVEERHVGQHEISTADGLFLTNSLRLLRPSPAHEVKDFHRLIGYICRQIETQCGRDPRTL